MRSMVQGDGMWRCTSADRQREVELPVLCTPALESYKIAVPHISITFDEEKGRKGGGAAEASSL